VPVGVGTQVEWYKQLVKDLSGCRVVPKSAHKIGQSADGVPVLRNLVFPSKEEIEEFERMLQKDFYLLLMRAISIEHSMGRGQFKGEFFRFLYQPALIRYNGTQTAFREDDMCYEEKVKAPVRLAMETLLPSIVHFLDICKCRPGTLDNRWDYYKHTARAIQSIESQIMLEVCNNLWTKHKNMFLVTLHDCIKCLPKDADKVQKELTRTFAKYHVTVKSKVDVHKRPSNVNG